MNVNFSTAIASSGASGALKKTAITSVTSSGSKSLEPGEDATAKKSDPKETAVTEEESGKKSMAKMKQNKIPLFSL